MGHYIGIEMSDHLSAMKPTSKPEKKDAYGTKKTKRKMARISRRRNRS